MGGSRGIGALEFKPAKGPQARVSAPVKVDSLVALASEVLASLADLRTPFADPQREHA